MVRDVWIDGGIDGQGNQVASIAAVGTPDKDGIRQGSEFFTVAVVGLRRGGNHYFALDVTDAGNDAGFPGKPRFLWLYPQPDDAEQLAFGETFADFIPTPPPIGPVRLDGGTAPCASGGGTYTNAAGVERCVEERWIVFLSGGFDPQYTRGRGVHMVDIGTGAEIWDFSQPKGAASSCGATSDPRCHLNYPVASPVGMMMWGKGSKYTSAAALEGYFDTATFGDTGGQLWVLRFNEPGIIDASTGKVNNWFGARVFQHGLTGTTPECGLDYCGAQPFFHVTANLPLRQSGLYRVLAGTGDRFNLLDPTGGICSPTNLRACLLKGCTVNLDDGTGGDGAVYEVDLLGGERYHSEQAAACGAFATSEVSYESTVSTSATASLASQRVRKLDIQCPSTNVCTGNTTGETVAKDVAVDCVDGYCAVQGNYDYGSQIELKNDTGKTNWFFSVLVFDPQEDRNRMVFDDEAGAKRYDAARLDDSDLTSVNDADGDSTKPYATADGAGWKYFFDHGDPNATGATVAIDGLDHHIYRSDERVASTTAVEASCSFWNTLQVALPVGARELSTDCPVNSPCKAGKRQLTYLYGGHPGTGEKCMYVDGALARVQSTKTVVPPQMGKIVAYVASGQVNFGLTDPSRGGGGATNISLGESKDVTSLMHWLHIDRQTEACRHWPRDSATPPPWCK
jgi:type IV pilus assembly protein PilY1